MIFSIFSTFYYLRCSAHPRSKFEISKRMSRTWSSPSRSTLRNSISKGSIRSTRGCFCSSWRGRGTSLERSVNKFLSFSSLSKFNSFFFSYFSFFDECLIFHIFFFLLSSRLWFRRRFTGAQSVQRQWYLSELWEDESEDQDWQSTFAS